MRRGRFDRIFFMDLPDIKARMKIISIHLGKHGYDHKQFTHDELTQMVDSMDKFTGAEIESVITEAIIQSLVDNDGKLTASHIIKKANETTTIDKNKTDIKELAAWAEKFATKA